MKHLIPQVQRYFKTALHCHTNISDGVPSPEEMKEIYKSKGYQVLSITDHNILVDHSAMNEEDFLLVTGVEYNINEDNTWAERRFWVKTYHLNFIAKRPDILWQPYIPKHPKEESRHYLEKVEDGGFPWVYDLDNINAMIAEGMIAEGINRAFGIAHDDGLKLPFGLQFGPHHRLAKMSLGMILHKGFVLCHGGRIVYVQKLHRLSSFFLDLGGS